MTPKGYTRQATIFSKPPSPPPAKPGGGGLARSAKTEGAALGEAERGMGEMSAEFAEVGKELYVSEGGQKREAVN